MSSRWNLWSWDDDLARWLLDSQIAGPDSASWSAAEAFAARRARDDGGRWCVMADGGTPDADTPAADPYPAPTTAGPGPAPWRRADKRGARAAWLTADGLVRVETNGRDVGWRIRIRCEPDPNFDDGWQWISWEPGEHWVEPSSERAVKDVVVDRWDELSRYALDLIADAKRQRAERQAPPAQAPAPAPTEDQHDLMAAIGLPLPKPVHGPACGCGVTQEKLDGRLAELAREVERSQEIAEELRSALDDAIDRHERNARDARVTRAELIETIRRTHPHLTTP